MSQPPPVTILSDDDDDDECYRSATPLPIQSKKQRRDSNCDPNSAIFIIDDDPTPSKQSSTPSFVAETPMLDCSDSYVPVVKRCTKSLPDSPLRFSPSPNPKSSGPDGLICLESDNESEDFRSSPWKRNKPRSVTPEVTNDLEMDSRGTVYPMSCGTANVRHISAEGSCDLLNSDDNLPQVSSHPGEEDDMQSNNNMRLKGRTKHDANKKRNTGEATGRARVSKEEKSRLMNEKKQLKEQEKLQKAALKAQAAEMKKMQKEIQSWEKGKFCQQSIVAMIDRKVVEQGSIGGHLLTRLAEKGVAYQITSNPVERSIIWTMSVPENIAQALSRGTEIPYVLLVYEAEEFCSLATNDSLADHIGHVQRLYPSYTICYLTNRLMAYINKREQEYYKNPSNHSGWKRPPVEELLSNLTTHFVGVHSRLCTDEAELAEHIAGLTTSLASCQFRKKLSRLSVNANGSLVSKDCADRSLIKKSSWLKALVAIPKVQPRFALAIRKKYPTMKSLLSVYLDPNKTVHEKEFLLEDLTTEGLVGDDRRLGEVCSKRVYRILTARCGTMKTDDAENGADFFH